MAAKISPRTDPDATGPRDWTEYEQQRRAARTAATEAPQRPARRRPAA